MSKRLKGQCDEDLNSIGEVLANVSEVRLDQEIIRQKKQNGYIKNLGKLLSHKDDLRVHVKIQEKKEAKLHNKKLASSQSLNLETSKLKSGYKESDGVQENIENIDDDINLLSVGFHAKKYHENINLQPDELLSDFGKGSCQNQLMDTPVFDMLKTIQDGNYIQPTGRETAVTRSADKVRNPDLSQSSNQDEEDAQSQMSCFKKSIISGKDSSCKNIENSRDGIYESHRLPGLPSNLVEGKLANRNKTPKKIDKKVSEGEVSTEKDQKSTYLAPLATPGRRTLISNKGRSGFMAANFLDMKNRQSTEPTRESTLGKKEKKSVEKNDQENLSNSENISRKPQKISNFNPNKNSLFITENSEQSGKLLFNGINEEADEEDEELNKSYEDSLNNDKNLACTIENSLDDIYNRSLDEILLNQIIKAPQNTFYPKIQICRSNLNDESKSFSRKTNRTELPSINLHNLKIPPHDTKFSNFSINKQFIGFLDKFVEAKSKLGFQRKKDISTLKNFIQEAWLEKLKWLRLISTIEVFLQASSEIISPKTKKGNSRVHFGRHYSQNGHGDSDRCISPTIPYTKDFDYVKMATQSNDNFAGPSYPTGKISRRRILSGSARNNCSDGTMSFGINDVLGLVKRSNLEDKCARIVAKNIEITDKNLGCSVQKLQRNIELAEHHDKMFSMQKNNKLAKNIMKIKKEMNAFEKKWVLKDKRQSYAKSLDNSSNSKSKNFRDTYPKKSDVLLDNFKTLDGKNTKGYTEYRKKYVKENNLSEILNTENTTNKNLKNQTLKPGYELESKTRVNTIAKLREQDVTCA